MKQPPSLSIVQVGTVDHGGGAAAVARDLHRGYAARGHRSWQVVGRKQTGDRDVVVLPDDWRAPYRITGYTVAQSVLRSLAGRYPDRGFGMMSRALRLATHPSARMARANGEEDFEFPGTGTLLDLNGGAPDVVHAHNLHGGYFDLRALETISARVPTVITLHDMWMLTGHCAHSLDCNRWTTGCGQCPDLQLDPAIRRDATAENWRRKEAIFAASALHVATPSRWLRDRVSQSMLGPHVRDLRVIPNGIDTTIFRPADRRAARTALGLPVEGRLVLLTTGSRGSMWKDDRTLRGVMARLSADASTASTLFIAVGRESAVSGTGAARTLSIPFQRDARVMAQYYQAADVYLHAARADTFPLAVLESMACGTPVVATSVGGIPEQIDAGQDAGVLVKRGDAAAMAAATIALLTDDHNRLRMGERAAAHARARFDVTTQVSAYLDWFEELVSDDPSA
jgi:glycosyltransferase involved in cell wall biosynthesis